MPKRISADTVVIIGMGRFGTELAITLMDLGREVLVIERDPDLVARVSPLVTLAVEADGTRKDVLLGLGVQEAGTAVVAIGSSLEASVLATSALRELADARAEDARGSGGRAPTRAGAAPRTPRIVAKAVTKEHKRILELVGADQVVFPELEMGNRVAHLLVSGGVQEYVDFANGYAISMLLSPKWLIGQTVGESDLMSKFNVSCVGVQRNDSGDFEAVSPRTRFYDGDRLVVAGRKKDVEQFAIRAGRR